MPTSGYLLPAIFLNPVLVLHSINTFFSYRFPPPLTSSTSSHSYIEKLGPLPGSSAYFDVHSNENLCWTYTIIMVFAQVLAYSKIAGNRIKRKTKLRKEGKSIKHSRWSEPEESKVAEVEVIRREKRKELGEMDNETRRRNSEKTGTDTVGGVLEIDSTNAMPYNLRSKNRLQGQNGKKEKAITNGHGKHGSLELTDELNGSIHHSNGGIKGGNDALELEDDEDMEEDDDDEDEDEGSVETETSEEVMIV